MSGPDYPASWIAKADGDLLCIHNNLVAARIPFDAVCFHAQQAAEKALKALLAQHAALIPRSHDLLALLDACTQAGARVEALRADAYFLNPFSVAARYPGLAPDPDEPIARQAAAAAQRVVIAIKGSLPQ